MRRPLVLTPDDRKMLEHYSASVPEDQRARFRRIVEQRLCGEPSKSTIEAVCTTTRAEMRRGEPIALFGDRP
jgi:hypothetical protein